MPGEGSVYPRRDPSSHRVIGWIAQLSIGPREQRRYVRRSARTRSDARVVLDELRDEQRAGGRPSRLTTGAYLEQWVRDARNIRPATRRGYEAVVNHHLVPHIGHVRLADLNPLHVEHLLASLSSTMAAKSLRNVHAVLRRALNQAVRSGLLVRNVAGRDFVDTPRVPDREPEAFSADEVRQLLDAVAGDRLEALYRVAIGTGLRSGELLGLAWEDIDLGGDHGRAHRGVVPTDAPLQRVPAVQRPDRRSDSGGVGHLEPDGGSGRIGDDLRGSHARAEGSAGRVAHAGRHAGGRDGGRLLVRRELVRRDGRYLREEPKTEGSKRSVPLSPAVAAALRSHRERLIAEGFVPTNTGPVFVNTSGGPLNGSWLTHHAQRLYERAGIRRLDFKALRATFASRLFEAGVSDMEIARLMGHTRTHTTKRHYIALGERSATALDAIEEMVG